KPWAPFRTRQDFEYAETMYLNSTKDINAQLKFLHGSWAPRGTLITLQNAKELHEFLDKAAKYVVQFKCHEFDEEFEGETHHFRFYYRDPWEWLVGLLTDPTLADDIVWFPCRKYLVIDGVRHRLRDEPQTANLWWDIQETLPSIPGLPHCLVPLLIWLDEGRVTSHTNLYPILLRPLFLPSQIRNGSGNGGSVQIGFMPVNQVKDRRGAESRSSTEKIAFSKFKRDIYHRVLQTIFGESLGARSHNGECVKGGDGLERVVFPAIPVASMDGKEADIFTATRGPLSHFPCSQCLVRTDQLHNIYSPDVVFPARNSEAMETIWKEAKAMRFKTKQEEHLQNYGLHDTQNTFWRIKHSCPYRSISYDMLHSDDMGKFGKRLWPRLKEVMKNLKTLSLLSINMAAVARWPGLQHFDNVLEKEMNDGDGFLDIEKSLLPCIVQALPRDSPWVHAIRAHIQFRMMMRLHCLTDEQIARKEQYQVKYGKMCENIKKKHPECSTDFPKQHAVYHSTADILAKGAPSTYCTRANEGIHQENREAIALGNNRDIDRQAAKIDVWKEAMAQIRMHVDAHDEEINQEIKKLAEETGAAPTEIQQARARSETPANQHWRLGSPGNLVNS
ncbi:hypothetical protein FB45DRAFT_690887, partial [Roridomyces roridus]